MAKLAGLYLHLDIPFDEIEEYEAEQYVKDIGKKYASLLYGNDLEL